MVRTRCDFLAAGREIRYHSEMDKMEDRRCSCGTELLNASVYSRGVYMPHDRILLSLGATRRPVHVEIRCTQCQHVFATSENAVLRERACARDWLSRDEVREFQSAV